MINGKINVIQENLDMKSTLKYLISNRIALLSVFDVAIIIWIAWYEGRIEYEPLLEKQYEVLKENNDKAKTTNMLMVQDEAGFFKKVMNKIKDIFKK